MGNPTTLELTEVETKLRQLLLDVATYIDNTAGPGPVESAVKVPEELTKEKIVLRFTGGWVRDKLLGVGSNDIDVAINKMTGEHFGLKILEYLKIPGNPAKYGMEPFPEEPEKVEQVKKAKNAKPAKPVNLEKSRKIAPGMHKIQANPEKSKNLETTTTNIMGIDLDLVNLRKETYNEVSRNPQIEFGTPEEDAMRRDATVNAMFYNLNTSQIEDFTGLGFKDMEAKLLRTPLEPFQTFRDDPLRVLRLIRFASRLNYKIDPETETAMSNPQIGQVLKIKISRERVGIEFEKMLKGPDPLMALQLIDRLGLYETIFTDPARDMGNAPDIDYFAPAYKFVASLSTTPDISEVIPKTLVRNPEEKYLAWVCASVMPWADAPMVKHQKVAQRPYYAAYLVAREGFKAPNRISDIIAASLEHGDEIRQYIDQCYTQLRRPNATKVVNDITARDALGMAIRRWGPTWRTQVLFSLIYEIVLGSISRERILEAYTIFLDRVTTFNILEAYTFKPLITGTELAKELNTKPGPWMRDALDVVMAWQLRNPDITDPAEAIEAVKSTTKNSELSSALASHFLTLTVRPLFSQAKPNPSLTPAGHKAPTRDQKVRFPEETSAEAWKDGKNAAAIELLRWTLSSLDEKGVEANWGLLVPPILRMMDDVDTKWKATGSELLTLLLKSTPPPLLARTGLGNVFEDSLMPLFTYLPTMTPENESIALLEKSFPALMALADIMYPTSDSTLSAQANTTNTNTAKKEKSLDKLLRDGILAPLFHAPPAAYPGLATTLLSHLPPLLAAMQIDSVKHIQPLTTLLSNILAEPLGLAHAPLMLAAAKGLQSVISNAWPRVGVYRGDVVRGVAFSWLRCCEDDAIGREGVEGVKGGLREVVGMLDAVLKGDTELAGVWEEEKRGLVEADERLGELFDDV